VRGQAIVRSVAAYPQAPHPNLLPANAKRLAGASGEKGRGTASSARRFAKSPSVSRPREFQRLGRLFRSRFDIGRRRQGRRREARPVPIGPAQYNGRKVLVTVMTVTPAQLRPRIRNPLHQIGKGDQCSWAMVFSGQ